MNILLVAPPYYRDVTIFPLGLAYVAAVLKNEGQNVEVLDLSVDTEKMPVLGDHIVKTQPDMIGITCATQTFRSALEVAKIAKQSLPDVKVIVGGPHPTIMKENILKHPEFDIAVIGEGEETIAELSHILEVGGSLCSVQGIIWKQGEKIHSNEQRPLIKNLDSLPFPARNLFPLSHYKVAGSIQTSRGCPYRCIYCITSNISPGRTWRARSPANVIAEMQMMYHEFNIRRFQIMDDDFTVNRKRVFEICDLIRKQKLNINFELFSGVRADLVDEALLRKMKGAGLDGVLFGIESFDDVVLRNIKKDLTVEQALKAIRLAKKVGIPAKVTLMVGNPGDNLKTIRKAMRFIESEDIDYQIFANPIPYPGTELYSWVREHGHLLLDNWDNAPDAVGRSPFYYTSDFTLEERLQAWNEIRNFLINRSKRAAKKKMIRLVTNPRYTFLRAMKIYSQEGVQGFRYAYSRIIRNILSGRTY